MNLKNLENQTSVEDVFFVEITLLSDQSHLKRESNVKLMSFIELTS